MSDQNLIAIEHFCNSHNIEIDFVTSLHQFELIQLKNIEENLFIEITQLPEIKRCITFYYDLEINLEGIEAIVHLLRKIKTLQTENSVLKGGNKIENSFPHM